MGKSGRPEQGETHDEVRGLFTREYLHEYCNGLDASMFSGDAFYVEKNRIALRYYIERWSREMDSLDEEAAGIVRQRMIGGV